MITPVVGLQKSRRGIAKGRVPSNDQIEMGKGNEMTSNIDVDGPRHVKLPE